ncbi:MAG TPA: MarR family transcriptional regulator [Dehalococcoidia bacterium]|nr:MarR family transcriptional regulator [Dehalococcoidia bacterium]
MQTTDTDVRVEALTLFGRLFVQSDPSRLEEWARLGLTMTQVRVLALLEAEQGLRAGDLASKLGVLPSTVTRIVDRLVQNRLVKRDVDPEDRRMVQHFVTSRGIDALTQLRRSGRARFNEVFDRLSAAQLARVVAALRDLTDALDAIDLEAVR